MHKHVSKIYRSFSVVLSCRKYIYREYHSYDRSNKEMTEIKFNNYDACSINIES